MLPTKDLHFRNRKNIIFWGLTCTCMYMYSCSQRSLGNKLKLLINDKLKVQIWVCSRNVLGLHMFKNSVQNRRNFVIAGNNSIISAWKLYAWINLRTGVQISYQRLAKYDCCWARSQNISSVVIRHEAKNSTCPPHFDSSFFISSS